MLSKVLELSKRAKELSGQLESISKFSKDIHFLEPQAQRLGPILSKKKLIQILWGDHIEVRDNK